MFTPRGHLAQEIDQAMLLNMWAHHLDQKNAPRMLYAGIGKPGYSVDEEFVLSSISYWMEHLVASRRGIASPIDYGLPSGMPEATHLMANSLSNWYGTSIESKDLLFTVGGCGGLRMVFRLLHQLFPHKKIVTPLPYYPFYHNPAHHNRFHFIDLFQERCNRLTADRLQRSIQEIGSEKISAFLFCDPHNPLGTVMGETEWKKIAIILNQTPCEIPIIVDEAYAELTFGEKHISLLSVAPELRERLIVMRSATKGFSASGERIALLLCFNSMWKAALEKETIFSYGHAPKSLQWAYAHAMDSFTEEKRVALSNFYREQVLYAQSHLLKIGSHIPINQNSVEGTFYVMANLSELFGAKIPPEAEQALGYQGEISTDVELCYSLLASDRVMICPLSFFGADPKLGYVRITCGNGLLDVCELITRLESRICLMAESRKEELSNA